MANKLKEFDFRTGPNRKYDYDKFFNGEIWELVKGEDFNCKAKSIRSVFQRVAKEEEIKIKTALPDGQNGNRIVIQAVREI